MKRFRNWAIVTFCAISAAAVAETLAQGSAVFGPPPGFGPDMGNERKLVNEFDKNHDGWLNQRERKTARAFLKKNPQMGRGGPAGFPGGGRGFSPLGFMVTPLLESLDTDKDSKLSSDELTTGARQFFARANVEKQPALTDAQVISAISQLVPAPPFPGPPPGFPGAGGRLTGFGPGNFIGPALMKRADKNSDGKLTEAELVEAAVNLIKDFDKNKDSKLDEVELDAAFAAVAPPPQFGPRGPGGPGGPGGGPFGRLEPGRPGPKLKPEDVKPIPDAQLYDAAVMRTIFFEFENKDWETELQEFHGTDVDVPATLLVDGQKYDNVGVHFRGMSSYGMVPAGSKRSFNVSLDMANSKQRLYGVKTLNLLNSHEDPSFMSTVLYSRIARKHMPVPQANFVKVVINGESWGVYVNVQQFNKDFLAENYPSSKGTRWKVRGNPMGGGGLEYIGDNIDDYKKRYDMKSADDDKAWLPLVELCRTLNETPSDQLEEAIRPMLDIDEVLWFLALDVALINNDGYWVRASDYSIFRDQRGVFHVIPHDMNEALHGVMMFGPGALGGPGGGGIGGFLGGLFGGGNRERRPEEPRREPRLAGAKPGAERSVRSPAGATGAPPASSNDPAGLDPLVAIDDPRKPLRSKLLAVPTLRAKYLQNVRTIAEQDLNWEWLGPIVAELRSTISSEIKADTRKLSSYEDFLTATDNEPAAAGELALPRPAHLTLRAFANRRRDYLLNHADIKMLPK